MIRMCITGLRMRMRDDAGNAAHYTAAWSVTGGILHVPFDS
jgi:hypothetical protein